MTQVVLENLRKMYGRTTAVDSVSLTIESGELFFLLGPSGCGKTTLLRMIAGFVEPTEGCIRFGETDVTNRPPEKRETGMVFQSYALWPHMTVAENVAFGLTSRKVSRADREARVSEALKSVRMQDYAKRKPNELSGGQQQRIALARALVIRPQVLLLDEPLSNLDAKLRSEMRSEIRRLCTETGITTIYVTHDQKEALSMADAVAVLRDGNIVQVGPPREIYHRPTSRFVADFLGETNFLPAEVSDATNGTLLLDTPAGPLESAAFSPEIPKKGNVTCSIRPEALKLSVPSEIEAKPQAARGVAGNGSGIANQWTARVLESIYLGEIAQHTMELPGEIPVKVFELNPRSLKKGQMVTLSVDANDVIVLND